MALSKKIGFGTYIITIIILLAIAMFFGWGVWHQLNGGNRLGKTGEKLVALAQLPNYFLEGAEIKSPVWEVNKTNQHTNLVINKQGADTGYMLLSSYDITYKQVVIKLYSLKDKKVIHTWIPNLDAIKKLKREPSVFIKDKMLERSHFRALHPYLTDDTGIIIKGDYGIIKLNKNSAIEWYIDGQFHHPSEIDAEGNLWTASIIIKTTLDTNLYPAVRDDGIVKLSLDGKILYEKSIARILLDNGYRTLLAGIGQYENDPVHVNDIQPCLYSSPYWQTGDLFISMRNKSTIFLYRPSTNKIIWLQTGPWMNQHDVSIVDSNRIGVIGNNVIRDGKTMRMNGNYNSFYVYDFRNNTIDTPFNVFMRKNNIATKTEGRVIVFNDGNLFVEETMNGRILMGNNNETFWSYEEPVDEKHVAIMGWSRYYLTSPLNSK